MRKPAKLLMPAFLAMVVGAVVVTSGCTVWRLDEARALVERSEPLQSVPANAAQRLLIQCAANPVVHGRGRSADGEAVLAVGCCSPLPA